MKNKLSAIILGAGKELPDQLYHEKSPPTSLLEDQYGESVLKWILNALKINSIEKISFVGGYEIEKIGKNFPALEFIYNANWKKSGVLESLYHARKSLKGPVIVSYGDIVYTGDVMGKIINNNLDGITIAYDSTFKAIRSKPGETRKNLVRINENLIEDIGFLPFDSTIDGEFIGLTYFDSSSTDFIMKFFMNVYPNIRRKPFEQAKETEYGYLTDLLRYLKSEGLPIHGVDIGKNWAEINDRQSLARFVMGTKSETLERLTSALKKSILCNQYTFTVNEWIDDKVNIINRINKTFPDTKVAVRSSSHLEDSFTKSNAGVFESVLNVYPKEKKTLENAINTVITSYSNNDLIEDTNHQVLVQEMVNDVSISGVVFTKDMETGAPYYVISYDDSSNRTDTVTSGSTTDITTVMINKSIKKSNLDEALYKILESVLEVENVTGYDSLDIEFAMNLKNEVYILQVRPIASLTNKATIGNNKLAVDNLYVFLKSKFSPHPNLFGRTTIYADMPDWNPAEMIGVHPRPLAYSMYDYLIMNKAWRIARGAIGYKNPKSTKLMVNLLGHVFVDVRATFNNLTPATLPDELFEKLINYYLARLTAYPDMHDKVEFEVVFTCLDFSFGEQSNRLKENGFNKDEINILKNHLYQLTNNIVTGKIQPIDDLLKLFEKRATRSNKILKDYNKSGDWALTIKLLLDDCITYGTVPFSILARYAFISNSLLRSLVARNALSHERLNKFLNARNALSHERLNKFLNSIDTVATELVSNLDKYFYGKLTKFDFINKYGHLRPGTYDITSRKYSENFDFYFRHQQRHNKTSADLHQESFSLTTTEKLNISKLLNEYNFSFEVEELFDFSIKAISMREFGKFEFTKCISDVFDLIIEFGRKIDINRDDLSFLNVYDLINASNVLDPWEMKTVFKNIVDKNKKLYTRNKIIHLPYIITSPDDINYIKIPKARPNYVTHGKVSGETVLLDSTQNVNNLTDKIVLIEGADPGYDWIFTHDIIGLITKYGGSASHMTIRANEFNLPAAIGCGENLFSKIMQAKIVELNCAEKYINVY